MPIGIYTYVHICIVIKHLTVDYLKILNIKIIGEEIWLKLWNIFLNSKM